jgi:hypothetical protein
MRRDRIICAQRLPVKWPPDGPINNVPMSDRIRLYLRNPHMKSTIYSAFATKSEDN